jgi:alpha-ketoglutarate-dependent taurine dioxygenase
MTGEAQAYAGATSAPGRLPLVVEAAAPDQSLLDALPALRARVDSSLGDSGGVLLRGYRLDGADGLRSFARAFGHALLTYDFASTPRSLVADGIYSSTEYPAHQEIPLHNEQSYARDWPMKIWFHCVTAAASGGETPIADSRAVYRRVDAGIRRRFEQRGVMYVRNFGEGLDVPWQRTFGTDDPAEVEAYCRAHAIEWQWKEDGGLRTRQVAQAVAAHPASGELVWFNQAHLFHVSALEPALREALLDAVGPDELPRNACYGDGGEIEPSALDEIRAAYAELRVVFTWRPGDVLMLDNMLVAHGRTAFTGARRVMVAMAEPHRPAPSRADA